MKATTSTMKPETSTLHIPQIVEAMRRAGRDELVHYAGAAHRDLVAWHMTAEWLVTPGASEAELKRRALVAAGYPSSTIGV
jgi:hypothetical protein